jgi:hypothetical protein
MLYDLLQPGNAATFLLSFVAGILVSKFFKTKGIGGCLVYLSSIIVIVIIISALWKGYSFFIERVTYNLESYIYSNVTGVIGFILGFLLGLAIFHKAKQ